MTEINTHPPVTFCWIDLATTDAEEARKLYAGLFGWMAQAHDRDMTFFNQNRRIAGMRRMAEAWAEMWPQWLVYFVVPNYEAGVERVEALGGEVIKPPVNNAAIGPCAIIQDPQGHSLRFSNQMALIDSLLGSLPE